MKKWIKRIVLIVIAIVVINAVFSKDKPARTSVSPTVTHSATAKPLPTKAPEQKPAGTPEPAAETVPASGIRPEFKAAMDSYASFFDSYTEILTAYTNNPADLGLMTQYLGMMSQYEEAMNAINSVNEAELTNEELAYYLQVTANIEQKMLLALG